MFTTTVRTRRVIKANRSSSQVVSMLKQMFGIESRPVQEVDGYIEAEVTQGWKFWDIQAEMWQKFGIWLEDVEWKLENELYESESEMIF